MSLLLSEKKKNPKRPFLTFHWPKIDMFMFRSEALGRFLGFFKFVCFWLERHGIKVCGKDF